MPPPVCNPNVSPFDLETGVRVASKVGDLHSKFLHARPLDSGIIRYVRDGRTDGQTDRQTDRQKQRLLPLPYSRGNNDTTRQATRKLVFIELVAYCNY